MTDPWRQDDPFVTLKKMGPGFIQVYNVDMS